MEWDGPPGYPSLSIAGDWLLERLKANWPNWPDFVLGEDVIEATPPEGGLEEPVSSPARLELPLLDQQVARESADREDSEKVAFGDHEER